MNQSKKSPLLSICIPTYNRAELLKLALVSLGSHIQGYEDALEIVVSDNCSPDDTQAVVQQARQHIPIRYHRNNENIGPSRNIMLASSELANGEFCWVLGDDDMVVRGKLGKLLNLIRANPDVDCFVVNFFYRRIDERNRLILERDSFYTPDKSECVCWDFSERRLCKWEELLDSDGMHPPYMYHYMGCNVFRRSMWRANAHHVRIEKNKERVDFDATFPHIKILAHAMVGRPAYYIGDPMVLLGTESQEWGVDWPAKRYKLTLASFRLYRSLGVEPARVDRLQHWILDHESHSIAAMVARIATPGRRSFSLRRFIWANRRYRAKIAKLLALVVVVWIFVRTPQQVQMAVKSASCRMRGVSQTNSRAYRSDKAQ